MATVSGTTSAASDTPNLPKTDLDERYATTAKKLGKDVDSLQAKLINAYEKGLGDAVIKPLEIKYQAAVRAMEGFMQMLKNMHEILMQGIRKLDVRG